MPTKQTTTSSQQQDTSSTATQTGSWANNYNPAAMAAYNAAIPQWQAGMSGFAQNPLQSGFFQNFLGQQQRNIGQAGQSQMSTMLNNFNQAGLSSSSPFAQSQMAAQGRAQSAQQSGGFNSLLQSYLPLQMQALQSLGGFNPLVQGGTSTSTQAGNQKMTGSSQQTQQMSGLGTWLPQLAGGALGLATGGLGGGLSSGVKSLMNKGGMQMPQPSGGMNNYSGLNMQNPFMYGSAGAPSFGNAGNFPIPNIGSQPTPGGMQYGPPSPWSGS